MYLFYLYEAKFLYRIYFVYILCISDVICFNLKQYSIICNCFDDQCSVFTNGGQMSASYRVFILYYPVIFSSPVQMNGLCDIFTSSSVQHRQWQP